MSSLDLEFDPTEMEPELAVPKHVMEFDALMDRYDSGIEPICNWRAEDVAKAFQCLHRELVERGVTAQETDDGI